MNFITPKLEQEILEEIERFQSKVRCENVGLVLDDGRNVFRHNSDFVGPAASLIKLLYGAAMFQHSLEEGIRSEEIAIQFDPSLLSGSNGSVLTSENGSISAYDLLYNMIVYSCNDSANHLANFIGLDFVNNLARKTDLKSSEAKGLFKRHPDFGERRIVDGPYRENRMSVEDAYKLVKLIFYNALYDMNHPNYFTIDPHRKLRFMLEEAHGSKCPHPLANYSHGGGIRHNLHPETLEKLVIGQKYGISFFDYGVAGYVFPIESEGKSKVYFISLLINGFAEPLKDHKGRGTETITETSKFVSDLSRKIYLASTGEPQDKIAAIR